MRDTRRQINRSVVPIVRPTCGLIGGRGGLSGGLVEGLVEGVESGGGRVEGLVDGLLDGVMGGFFIGRTASRVAFFGRFHCSSMCNRVNSADDVKTNGFSGDTRDY